jgi:hypothetical protein
MALAVLGRGRMRLGYRERIRFDLNQRHGSASK